MKKGTKMSSQWGKAVVKIAERSIRWRQLIGRYVIVTKPSMDPQKVLYAGPVLSICKGKLRIGGHFEPYEGGHSRYVNGFELTLNNHKVVSMPEPMLRRYLRANK